MRGLGGVRGSKALQHIKLRAASYKEKSQASVAAAAILLKSVGKNKLMRRMFYLICLASTLAIGCRDGNNQNGPVASGSKVSGQDQQSHMDTPDAQIKQPAAVQAAWSPPTNPDPQQILTEAQQDMAAGRYEEALAKHVWFHRDALDIDRAFYGVRLSFALMYWKELATLYPPAKTKLIEIRDEAEQKVNSGDNAAESFHDFEALNSVLGEDPRTVALFKKLDEDNPQVAQAGFKMARRALIEANETKLCSKYVTPDDYASQVEMYRHMLSMPKDPRMGEQHLEFARQSFTNEVTTLVALLVLSDRKAEAEKIVADAKTVWDDKTFAADLDKAFEGQVPEPWPPAMN